MNKFDSLPSFKSNIILPNQSQKTFYSTKQSISLSSSLFRSRQLSIKNKQFHEIKTKKKIQFSLKNLNKIKQIHNPQTINKLKSSNHNIFKSLITNSNELLTNSHDKNNNNKINSYQNKKLNNIQKLKSIIQKLITQLNIFNKLQSHTIKKKTLISKIYGWDQRFTIIFFNQQNIKNNLNYQIVMNQIYKLIRKNQKNNKNIFNNDKQHKSDNISHINTINFLNSLKDQPQIHQLYYKIKFFIYQLVQFNKKHQSLQMNQKKLHFEQSLKIFNKQIHKISLNSYQKDKCALISDIKKYNPLKIKKSLKHLIQKRKTKDSQIGQININKFEQKWGNDMDILEQLIEKQYKND